MICIHAHATYATPRAPYNSSPRFFAVHFWAPTFKWGITFANIADLQRPADKVSYPQQTAITATGVIWSRYSTQITPVNYNLLLVNVFMAITGSYQLFRKWSYEQSMEQLQSGPKTDGK